MKEIYLIFAAILAFGTITLSADDLIMQVNNQLSDYDDYEMSAKPMIEVDEIGNIHLVHVEYPSHYHKYV